MKTKKTNTPAKWLMAGIGAMGAAYAAYVAVTWLRYGHARRSGTVHERDPLLDRFMPVYEVVERHKVRVAASADVTFSCATEMDLESSLPVRGLFKVRALLMGGKPAEKRVPRPFVAQMRALGWGTLAETPNREIVFGAVTQPWLADVVFRPLGPGEFLTFSEPGYVKIIWTIRADPAANGESIFRTETRATCTDSTASVRFRRYWSCVSPGVWLIRKMALIHVKSEAERRARAANAARSLGAT